MAARKKGTSDSDRAKPRGAITHKSKRQSDSAQHSSPRPAGFGDDQGTRIGAPSPSRREHEGPSSQPVKEGLEGGMLEA
jgi:hypothetical protein